MLFGVVGAEVHRAAIFPFIHEPGKIRSFALAPDMHGIAFLAIPGIVRAADDVIGGV